MLSKAVFVPVMAAAAMGRYAPTISTFLTSGVTRTHCMGAYQPACAVNLAASYINLSNPGVNNANPIVAPTWNENDGWMFNGVDQYLDTGIIPADGTWSMIVLFTDAKVTGADQTFMVGAINVTGGIKRFSVSNYCGTGDPNKHQYGLGSNGGGYLNITPKLISGTMTIAGPNGYTNGSLVAGLSTSNVGATIPVFIGCANLDSTPTGFTECNIQAVGVYDITLTADQILAITHQMRDDIAAHQRLTPYSAYVETTGDDATAIINDEAHPFATINAALRVHRLFPVTLYIGAGTFAPVSGDINDSTLMRNNMRFYGSGQPTIKADHTGLETGTIIKGPLVIDRNGIELYDLGVDSGSAVCTADYAGVAQEGINFANMYPILQEIGKAKRTGFIAKRITTICQAYNSLVHSFLVENCIGAVIDTISTCYGFAGMVLKTDTATVTNLTCMAHNFGALYCKTSAYSIAQNTTIANVVVNSINAGDTLPVFLTLEDAVEGLTLRNFTITNVVNNTNRGVTYYVDANCTIDNCDIVNLTGQQTVFKSGAGIISNCEVNGTAV